MRPREVLRLRAHTALGHEHHHGPHDEHGARDVEDGRADAAGARELGAGLVDGLDAAVVLVVDCCSVDGLIALGAHVEVVIC